MSQGPEQSAAQNTVMKVLLALSCAHLINDTLQALLPSIYPVLKETYGLNFTQISNLTLTYQVTGSILQPLVGFYTDRHPKPYSLPVGMGVTLIGLVMLALAKDYFALCLAAGCVGVGSSFFHPEASRVARMASGGQHGLAQSLFQVGGNFGTSLGPLLAAAIITVHGQTNILWFTLLALAGILLLVRVGRWYQRNLGLLKPKPRAAGEAGPVRLSRGKVMLALATLVVLVFSKYFYLISLTNYYTFYLIDKFQVSVQTSQICLFVFLFAVAAGTIIGGPVGDRIGRKRVIWISILGVAPFSLVLPHLGLAGTVVFTVLIGVILASAFSAILVYAQELVPGNVGLIAGLFFGLAFGAAGIGSALLGRLADHTSIRTVFEVSAYFPLLGLFTAFLPEVEPKRRAAN
ncbi:MFS transporter [Opitutus sp. GAS368]|uniref:MFS transporter n=1 Tax=Opitutus sp. GAS368 TaxID=1882749 RepID=UPI001E59F1F1|nr:MFS transporter [Opitutus sp. GAS368]